MWVVRLAWAGLLTGRSAGLLTYAWETGGFPKLLVMLINLLLHPSNAKHSSTSSQCTRLACNMYGLLLCVQLCAGKHVSAHSRQPLGGSTPCTLLAMHPWATCRCCPMVSCAVAWPSPARADACDRAGLNLRCIVYGCCVQLHGMPQHARELNFELEGWFCPCAASASNHSITFCFPSSRGCRRQAVLHAGPGGG